MTEAPHRKTKPGGMRASYDIIADEYARRIYGELKDKPFDRQWLDSFAERTRGACCGRGDLYCWRFTWGQARWRRRTFGDIPPTSAPICSPRRRCWAVCQQQDYWSMRLSSGNRIRRLNTRAGELTSWLTGNSRQTVRLRIANNSRT